MASDFLRAPLSIPRLKVGSSPAQPRQTPERSSPPIPQLLVHPASSAQDAIAPPAQNDRTPGLPAPQLFRPMASAPPRAAHRRQLSPTDDAKNLLQSARCRALRQFPPDAIHVRSSPHAHSAPLVPRH